MNVSSDPALEGRKILSPLRGSPEAKPLPRPHGRGYILTPLRGWKPPFVPSPLRGWKPPFVPSPLRGWKTSLLVVLIVGLALAAHGCSGCRHRLLLRASSTARFRRSPVQLPCVGRRERPRPGLPRSAREARRTSN